MATDLATVTDVETVLLRPLSESERGSVPGLITMASALLRHRLPDVDARITAFLSGEAGLDPVIVALVIAKAVKRALTNPEGASSRSEGVGPFSETYAFRSADGEVLGGLEITDGDMAELVPPEIRSVVAQTVPIHLGVFGAARARSRGGL